MFVNNTENSKSSQISFILGPDRKEPALGSGEAEVKRKDNQAFLSTSFSKLEKK